MSKLTHDLVEYLKEFDSKSRSLLVENIEDKKKYKGNLEISKTINQAISQDDSLRNDNKFIPETQDQLSRQINEVDDNVEVIDAGFIADIKTRSFKISGCIVKGSTVAHVINGAGLAGIKNLKGHYLSLVGNNIG